MAGAELVVAAGGDGRTLQGLCGAAAGLMQMLGGAVDRLSAAVEGVQGIYPQMSTDARQVCAGVSRSRHRSQQQVRRGSAGVSADLGRRLAGAVGSSRQLLGRCAGTGFGSSRQLLGRCAGAGTR